MFNKDCWERIGRAFVTGAISTATGLHFFGNGNFDITDLEHLWMPVVIGGLYAAITAAKAQIGLGRGEDSNTGSWKGIGTPNDA